MGHKSGSLDVTAALQKVQDGLVKAGYVSTPSTTQTLGLQASAGLQQYQLHHYTVTGAGTVEGGQEYGYLPVSSGYLFVQGNCGTASELTTTIPALQALQFDQSR